MDSCCPQPAAAPGRRCCVCGGPTVAVELQTVKALLTQAALRRLNAGHHRFCPNPTCDVVYIDEHAQTYGPADVRVAVWHKQPDGTGREICYCFGESEAGIRAEIARDRSCRAAERVRAHIVAGRCACDIRNPRGACCLGDLIAAVERINEELRKASWNAPSPTASVKSRA